jgi:hypothetical protein
MDRTDPALIAGELLVAQRQALLNLTDGERDHCVLFTRIAVDVCRERGVLAKPLVVSVEFRSDTEPDGMLQYGFAGKIPEDAPPDFWDGHLVAILDRRLMVDLSVDAAARPELGIAPVPFVAEVPSSFLVGGTFEIAVPEGSGRYFAHPNRKDFRDLPAWQQGSPEQTKKLADALLWHPERRI